VGGRVVGFEEWDQPTACFVNIRKMHTQAKEQDYRNQRETGNR